MYIFQTTKRSMFGTTSKTVFYWPALYYWLMKYKSLLVAKVMENLIKFLCEVGKFPNLKLA